MTPNIANAPSAEAIGPFIACLHRATGASHTPRASFIRNHRCIHRGCAIFKSSSRQN
jgi:hypothetical protein